MIASIDMTHSVENEYLCLKIAKAYGFDTADCDIITPDGVKALSRRAFLTGKFAADRTWIIALAPRRFLPSHGRISRKKIRSRRGVLQYRGS